MNYVRRHAGVYLDIRAGHAANIIPGKASITIAKDKVKSHYPLQEVMACFDSVQEIVRSYSSKKDNSFFPPTLTSNFGILKTKGTQTHLVFDFRLLPGQSIFKIERVLRKKIALKLKNHASKWMLRVDRQDAPLGLTASHRYVRSHRQLLKENGLALRLSSKPSCTEAGTYEAWGVPAVVFGPGAAQGNIHAPNEKINMQEIEKAISYYTSCIDEFAGKSS
jgi:acetylornithine deacetylase/succinyl-diaminopimelate desuccinylase-like protein